MHYDDTMEEEEPIGSIWFDLDGSGAFAPVCEIYRYSIDARRTPVSLLTVLDEFWRIEDTPDAPDITGTFTVTATQDGSARLYDAARAGRYMPVRIVIDGRGAWEGPFVIAGLEDGRRDPGDRLVITLDAGSECAWTPDPIAPAPA